MWHILVRHLLLQAAATGTAMTESYRICKRDTHPDDTRGLASQVQGQSWSKWPTVEIENCALASQIQSRTGTASQVLVQGATSNAQCAPSRARLATWQLAASASLRIANEKLPGSKYDIKERKKEAAWHSCTTSSKCTEYLPIFHVVALKKLSVIQVRKLVRTSSSWNRHVCIWNVKPWLIPTHSDALKRNLKESQGNLKGISRESQGNLKGISRNLKGISRNLKETQGNLKESQGIPREPQGNPNKESQGISRNPKEFQGISRNLKESQGISRNLKESQGISRNLKETQGISRKLKDSQGISRNPKESQGISRNLKGISRNLKRISRESQGNLKGIPRESQWNLKGIPRN